MNQNNFLKKLLKQKISYFNFNIKKFKKINTDIDIFIPINQQFKFKKFLLKNKFFKIKRPQKFNNKNFYIKFLNNEKFIILDVYKDIVFKQNYFKEYKLKKNYQNKINNKYLQNEEKSFFNLIFKIARYIYEKNKLSFGNFKNLKKEIARYNPKKKFFQLEKKKINEIFLNRDIKNFNLQIKIYLNKFFKISFNFNDLFFYFKKKIFVKNSYILLIGTDGSGKTTLSKSFKKLFYHNVGYNYFGMGRDNWRSQIFKSIFIKSKNQNSFLLKLVLLFEFILRKLNYLYTNRWKIIFVDRILVFTFLEDTFINKLLRIVYPNFDAVIYLHGNLKKIVNRKNDTNLILAKKNQIKINQFIDKLNISDKRICKINTTKNNLNQTKKIMINHILKNISIVKSLVE